MNTDRALETSFILEGQFMGFVWEGTVPKALRIAVDDEEVLQVKLTKQARSGQLLSLHPQTDIWIYGQTKLDRKSGTVKLKAKEIRRKTDVGHPADDLECSECTSNTHHPGCTAIPCEETITTCGNAETPPTALSASAGKLKKAKILLCQRSKCQSRGGKKQHQAIASILRERGLHEQVVIQETGCLGKCSMAPNVMLMPGKKRLSGMKPKAIADLLETLNSK